MHLETPQVLRSRWHVLREWRSKEWWYTGVSDARHGAYFSWYFTRVNLLDEFAFTAFDPAVGEPQHFSQRTLLPLSPEEGLSLRYQGRRFEVSYEGAAERGWDFRFQSQGFDVRLHIQPTLRMFTKFDRHRRERYGLLHFFHNRASGTVRTPARTYEVQDALCYYDHCFGCVPRATGWHWLAVQNEDAALSTLVNDGACPQCYTQVYFKRNADGHRLEQWIRLDQDVSFEQPLDDPLDAPWEVTSPDLELTVTPNQAFTLRERLPPLVPFFVNLDHAELFVTARGRVRVDGRWFDVDGLHGVMEQHFGRW